MKNKVNNRFWLIFKTNILNLDLLLSTHNFCYYFFFLLPYCSFVIEKRYRFDYLKCIKWVKNITEIKEKIHRFETVNRFATICFHNFLLEFQWRSRRDTSILFSIYFFSHSLLLSKDYILLFYFVVYYVIYDWMYNVFKYRHRAFSL